MKALVYDKDQGAVVFRDQYPMPKRQSGEALVKVKLAGICNTDIEISKGYAGFSGVLGHEFVGVIQEVEDSCGFSVGDRVTGEISVACENCEVCKAGGIRKRNHCPSHTVLGIAKHDGTFAEFLTLPVRNLHFVMADVPDERAVFTEPLAAAFRIAEQGLVAPDSKVAVIGDGKLGLLIAEALSTCQNGGVVMIGKHADKMALLPESVTRHVFSDDTSAVFANAFDVVVEVSGAPNTLALATALTCPLGTIVLKSTCAEHTAVDMTPVVVKEISIVGSRCGNFQMALQAMRQEKVKPEKYIAKVYPISEALTAFQHAKEPGTLKIVLKFD